MSDTYFAKSMVVALGFDTLLPIQEIDAMAEQQLPSFSLYCRKKEENANFLFKINFHKDASDAYHIKGYTAAILLNRNFEQQYIGSVCIQTLEEDLAQLPWNERYSGEVRHRLDAWNNIYEVIEKLGWIISSPSKEERYIGLYLALNYLPLSMLGSFYLTRDAFFVLPSECLVSVDFSVTAVYYPIDKAIAELLKRVNTPVKKGVFQFFK